MNIPNVEQTRLAGALRGINVEELPVSEYSKGALLRVLNAAEFYLEIYRNSLEKVLAMCNMPPEEITIVDYGGGHGILSILAKKLGFARVVYIDYNADALQTVQQMSERLGATPDVMLQGDAAVLRQWCESNRVKPNALLAMDVIEHIYVLDEFFGELHSISDMMKMVFTTASTPFNKRVERRLRRAMQEDELGTETRKGFWQKRRDYVQELHPDMSDRELDYWADNTRGLTYADVARAVESQSPNLLLDADNTCDPATGSWTERILPIDDYRQLLMPYGFTLAVVPGRYNEHRHGAKQMMSRYYNKIIDLAPDGEPRTRRERRNYKKALKVAPFIYLIIS